MDSTRIGQGRVSTSARLLIAAGVALAMAFVMVRVYPHLAASGMNAAVLTGLIAVTIVCMLAVFVPPVAAIVRRLTR